MLYASPELAVNTEAEAHEARAEVRSVQIAVDNSIDGTEDRKDHFIYEDGHCFAGRHLILDLYDAEGLDDITRIEAAMCKAVEECGATLLHIHLHHFSPNGGVSGVAVLAESHISIHTWPERDYAALDIFMCGDAQPHKAVSVFRDAFQAGRHSLNEHKRGSL